MIYKSNWTNMSSGCRGLFDVLKWLISVKIIPAGVEIPYPCPIVTTWNNRITGHFQWPKTVSSWLDDFYSYIYQNWKYFFAHQSSSQYHIDMTRWGNSGESDKLRIRSIYLAKWPVKQESSFLKTFAVRTAFGFNRFWYYEKNRSRLTIWGTILSYEKIDWETKTLYQMVLMFDLVFRINDSQALHLD